MWACWWRGCANWKRGSEHCSMKPRACGLSPDWRPPSSRLDWRNGVLRGRLTFTLRRNEVSGEIDGYEFEGETRFDQLFTGIAVERPKNMDPHDLSGTEGITAHDTGEADFGRLLERAYEKVTWEGWRP